MSVLTTLRDKDQNSLTLEGVANQHMGLSETQMLSTGKGHPGQQ